MNCRNCGANNENGSVFCENCGADLTIQKPKNILKNKKSLIMLSAIIIAIIVAIVIIFAAVIFPAIASARMRNAFESKSGANVMDIFIDYCGDYSVAYDDLSRSEKAVFNEFKECISDYEDELNEQPVDTDINDYVIETTGDIFVPQDYSAVTTIGQYNGELYNVVQDFYLLYSSKISYNMGITAYSEVDYSMAVSELSSVIESDSWYEDAQIKLTECQEKLLEEKLTLIDNYINSKDYDFALQQIDSLRNENLTDEMKSKLDDYETKIYEAKLSKIEDFINDGDVEGAKEYVESLGANLSDDAYKRLEQVLKNKADEYLTKADEALKSGERQGAYDMAVMAQTLCPGDTKIQEKVDYYKEYLPFELYNYNNILSEDYAVRKAYGVCVYYDYFNNNTVSNNSQRMENNIWLLIELEADKKNLYNLTYNLNKKYDILTGNIYVLQRSKNADFEGYIEIYGDGKKLYTSATMKKNVLPQDIKVDVSNVSTLVVKFYGEEYSGDAGYGVSNLVATKNLK